MSGLDAHIVASPGDAFRLDIALRIEPGTTAALLGPNGAGKSTTVDVFAGLLPLSGGHISLDGRLLDDPAKGVFVNPEQRRVGVVFQRYLLFEQMTVLDNVAFGYAAGGMTRKAARKRASKWVDDLDLGDFATRRPRELSGGEAQRVALARALATEPDLLLLDEPLAALDVGTRTELRRLLAKNLGGYPGPRLLITHDPTDAFLLADRIHIIEDGQITQSGTPADIRRRPATCYVAALAGTNLLLGHNRQGEITLHAGGPRLHVADTHTNGDVALTVHPTAIALHREEPHGSPRNAWQTTVTSIEPLGDTTWVTLGDPIEIGADITPGAAAALQLATGSRIWVSIKATEIEVTPVA